MKRMFWLLICLIPVYTAADEWNLRTALSVEQNGVCAAGYNGTYFLAGGPFTIIIDGITPDIPVRIQADGKNTYFSYTLPVSCEKSGIFELGHAFAMNDAVPGKGVDITATDEPLFNYIDSSRRFDKDGRAEILVSALEDQDNEIAKSHMAYMVIFADKNRNKKMEQGEVLNCIFVLNEPFFPDKNAVKAYVSTMGYYIKTVPDSYRPQDFILCKIKSQAGMQKFLQTIPHDVAVASYMETAPGGEDRRDYANKNFYVLYSPYTDTLFFDQPYHYNGDNRLIFDLQTNEKKSFYYIAARNYSVVKTKDIFELYVSAGGQLVKPVTYVFE